MRRDVMAMSWADFITEFKTMYYNKEVLATQQDEFLNFTQGNLTVMEAVQRFEELARLCPKLITSEEEKVRLMMKMLRTDIAQQVSAGSSPPRSASDCIGRAVRAEYWINRNREARAQFFKSKKEEKAMAKNTQQRQAQTPDNGQRGQPGNQNQSPR